MNGSLNGALIVVFVAILGCAQPDGRVDRIATVADKIQVRFCNGGVGCAPCSQTGAQGLSFMTTGPSPEPALERTVECRQGNAARCRDEARIEWRFRLDARTYYEVRLEYEATKATSTKFPPQDVYDAITSNALGPSFDVLSPAPKGGAAVWPYVVSVYDTTGGKNELVACADPEVIIDP